MTKLFINKTIILLVLLMGSFIGNSCKNDIPVSSIHNQPFGPNASEDAYFHGDE